MTRRRCRRGEHRDDRELKRLILAEALFEVARTRVASCSERLALVFCLLDEGEDVGDALLGI